MRISNIDDIYDIKVINIDTIQLNNPLIPIEQPIMKSRKYIKQYKINNNIYNSNNLLIDDDYKIINTNNSKILELYPFDYNPEKNILIVKTFEYDIQYNKQSKSINNKLCIIYPDTFSSIADTFRKFFIKRGKSVKMLPTSLIGTEGDSIVKYLRNEYAIDTFSFLLLLGDPTYIPLFVGIGYNTPNTDLNYSLMDTNDYFPDIIVSRLPFNDLDTLSAYFKNINNALLNKQHYVKSAYFMASDDASYHTLAESTQLYSMKKFRNIGYSVDSLFYYYKTGTPVDQAINSGYEYAFYSGHGSGFSWVGPSFNDEDIKLLNNYPNFPFIFSFACLTGNYYYHNFFGYCWLNKEDKGAIGYFGSSKETYWEEDDKLQRYAIDSIMGNKYLFDVMNSAKLNFYNYYGPNATLTRAYFEQYNYFSIPDLYTGNRNISNINFYTDKYQQYNSTIDFNIDFSGTLDKSFFISLFYNDTIIDSLSLNSIGNFSLVHNANINDTCYLNCYLPDMYIKEYPIILINDNIPYVKIKEYGLSDVLEDTFYFDIQLKNYGDITAHNISSFVKYLSPEFSLINDSLQIDSIQSESIFDFSNGLVLQLVNYDSLDMLLCSLGIVFDNETLYDELTFNDLSPKFDVEYGYTIVDTDTIYEISVGERNELYFRFTNQSNIALKNIECNLVSDNADILLDSVFISNINPGETQSIIFPIYEYQPDTSICNLNFIVNFGNFSDTFSFDLNFTLKNSYMFYGPINNYYIYTSDMVELENRPIFNDYREKEDGWTSLYFENDDQTIGVDLPFDFKFGSDFYNKIYVNFNGIISVDSLEDYLYRVQILPATNIEYPAFICAWHDYLGNAEIFDSDSLQYLNGHIVYKFIEDQCKFVILFNNVADYINPEDTFSFAIVLDTMDVTVNYYRIPEYTIYDTVNLVTGLQFAGDSYIELTGDTFFNPEGEQIIKNGFAIKFSQTEPKYIDKFTQKSFDRRIDPIVMSDPILRKSDIIYIGIYENKFYNISLYDVSGRKIQEFENKFLYKGLKTYNINLQSNGVYYILITDDKHNKILSSKLIVL